MVVIKAPHLVGIGLQYLEVLKRIRTIEVDTNLFSGAFEAAHTQQAIACRYGADLQNASACPARCADSFELSISFRVHVLARSDMPLTILPAANSSGDAYYTCLTKGWYKTNGMIFGMFSEAFPIDTELPLRWCKR